MKLARVTKKGNRSFYIEFLGMTLLPLIICGVVMMMVCSYSVKQSMTIEAEDNLKNVAMTVLAAYDHAHPGDYEAKAEGDNIILYKGETLISDDYEMLDGIEKGSRLEISLFYYDTRLVTTLKDASGNRMIRTVASEKLVNEVRHEAQALAGEVNQAARDANNISMEIDNIAKQGQRVSDEMQTVSAATQQQSASASEIARASDSLSHLADELQTSLKRFKY